MSTENEAHSAVLGSSNLSGLPFSLLWLIWILYISQSTHTVLYRHHSVAGSPFAVDITIQSHPVPGMHSYFTTVE